MSKHNLPLLKDVLLKAVQMAGFEINPNELQLDKTKTLEHGHFSTNVAMVLSGSLKKNPRELAQIILSKLESDLIEKAEIAGPGFINFFVEQKFYTTEARSIIENFDEYLIESSEDKKGKTMVIDYSHPNIAKPMGIHHLLSTVIGDAIKKIHRRAGWTVVADNFIGDMGTQFGKLIHAIKKWGDLEEIEKDPIPALLKLYVQFHFEAENEVELDDEARAEYRKFEAGDPESRELWKKIIRWSLLEMQPVYDRLEVEFDFMNGESFYEDKMSPILEMGLKKGIIQGGEKGALIIPADDPEGTPVLVKKSDGATLYATRDLARIAYWEKTWSPDLMVNVVDQAQSFYFKQLFFAQEKLGLTEAKNVHVEFGRMQFKDGQMSTRKGNILLLSEVLDEAEHRALKRIEEKGIELSSEEKIALSKIMGINSVKYNILSQNRATNITFDWDKMLSFEGNSAPYLMYTVARAKSIFRKGELEIKDCLTFDLKLSLDVEKGLMIHLLMYPDSLKRATTEFKPNHIANYLYELASAFNSFYNGNSILQADSEDLKNSRLLLTAAVIQVMEDGFGLLGMKVPERM